MKKTIIIIILRQNTMRTSRFRLGSLGTPEYCISLYTLSHRTCKGEDKVKSRDPWWSAFGFRAGKEGATGRQMRPMHFLFPSFFLSPTAAMSAKLFSYYVEWQFKGAVLRRSRKKSKGRLTDHTCVCFVFFRCLLLIFLVLRSSIFHYSAPSREYCVNGTMITRLR